LATLFWFIAYVAMVAAVVGAVVRMRRAAIEVYGTPDAQAEWDAWRADAKKMAEQPNPVKRRVPGSAEPPAVVLMRDHFAVCLVLAIVLSSVLFGTFMVLVRGAFSSGGRFVDRSRR
jgi:hypothetical protein